MNIQSLLKEGAATVNALLADGRWIHTDEYEIEPKDSRSVGCAHLYSLSKEITTNEEAAIIYLLQRSYLEYKALGRETFKKDEANVSANDLLNYLLGSGESSGVRLNPQAAWNKVKEAIHYLFENEQARLYKNGQETAPLMPFSDHNVKAVTAFLDEEKDSVFFQYLYFIETDTTWIYFSWGDIL